MLLAPEPSLKAAAGTATLARNYASAWFVGRALAYTTAGVRLP
jgi:hypothetical protein